ncbi:hypothetical protein PROFUN_12025 [Planoprotostelium fungivorum]|uniref:Uncharacterized protein n=1 Tax=Planoprotostelium fungivorum TaxID=1890364 RepID=A0A2P6MRF5_9EUKA|nr:hypothetical protein PROFUN_12025 [Planoprotostelium fungivorum]
MIQCLNRVDSVDVQDIIAYVPGSISPSTAVDIQRLPSAGREMRLFGPFVHLSGALKGLPDVGHNYLILCQTRLSLNSVVEINCSSMSSEVSYTNELQPSESPYPSHSLNLHPDPIYGGNEDSFENLIQTSQEEDSSSFRGWFAEHQIEGTKPSVEDERSRRSPNHRNQESYQEVAYFQETQKPTNDRDDSHTISPQPNHFVEVSINNRQTLHKQLQEEDAAKDTNGISHSKKRLRFETSSWGWASNNPLLLHNTIVDR